MKRALISILIFVSGLAAQSVLAQGGKPAGAKPAPAPGATTEHETPLGLYIIPWRNSDAAGGAGQPVRMLDQALALHDGEVFRREVEYHRALSEQLEKQGKVTP